MLRDKAGGHSSDHAAKDAVNTTDKDEHGDISCSLVRRGDVDDIGDGYSNGWTDEEESALLETINPVCLGGKGNGTESVDWNSEVVRLIGVVSLTFKESWEKGTETEDGDTAGEETDGSVVDVGISESFFSPLPVRLVTTFIDDVALLTESHQCLLVIIENPCCLRGIGKAEE